MPELPEVEVLVQYLNPLLRHRQISSVETHFPRSIRPNTPTQLQAQLCNATFEKVARRGKYLIFHIRHPGSHRIGDTPAVGHLGMTGRMFLQTVETPLPRHTKISLTLDHERFVFTDPRGFGRFNLDLTPIHRLGPEPWDPHWTADSLHAALHPSSQPIKVRLMDQSLMAGIGNIYANEILHRARIHPARPCQRLKHSEAALLLDSIQATLSEAIERGSSIPLDFRGARGDGIFYYGLQNSELSQGSAEASLEWFAVYDRAGDPCHRCGGKIRQSMQASRSTYFCPECQR